MDKPDIIAITVSTKYDDILQVVLPRNHKFFLKWYIITDPNDRKTIELVQNSGCPNVQLLIYHEFYNGATFNKGGAVRYMQDFVRRNHGENFILVLDSDIVLPENFDEVISRANLAKDTLYGIQARKDYGTYSSFVARRHSSVDNNPFIGYFQLYYSDPKYYYVDSQDASRCDDDFKGLFRNMIRLDMVVDHLGARNANWKGRNKIDFIMDDPNNPAPKKTEGGPAGFSLSSRDRPGPNPSVRITNRDQNPRSIQGWPSFSRTFQK